MNDKEILDVRKKAEDARIALYNRVKDMHPYSNIAAMDDKGNYLIPEYAEHVKWNTVLALLPATEAENSEYCIGLRNASSREEKK